MSEDQIFVNQPHQIDKVYEKAIRWQPLTSLTAQKRFELQSNVVNGIQPKDADVTKAFGGLIAAKN